MLCSMVYFFFIAYLNVVVLCEDNSVPVKCEDPDKIYIGCQSSSCIPTCTNPFPGPVCTADCVSGCFCRPNLFLDRKTNKCRTLEKCYHCKSHEVFSTCGTCDGTCDDPNPICTQQCRIGCFCKRDYVRLYGVCIPKKYCPSSDSSSSSSSSCSDSD